MYVHVTLLSLTCILFCKSEFPEITPKIWKSLGSSHRSLPAYGHHLSRVLWKKKFESSSILSFIHLAALISTGFISKWIREFFSGPTRGMPWVKTSELLLCFVQGQLSLRATFSLSTGSRELAFYRRLFTGTTWRFLSQSSTLIQRWYQSSTWSHQLAFLYP